MARCDGLSLPRWDSIARWSSPPSPSTSKSALYASAPGASMGPSWTCSSRNSTKAGGGMPSRNSTRTGNGCCCPPRRTAKCWTTRYPWMLAILAARRCSRGRRFISHWPYTGSPISTCSRCWYRIFSSRVCPVWCFSCSRSPVRRWVWRSPRCCLWWFLTSMLWTLCRPVPISFRFFVSIFWHSCVCCCSKSTVTAVCLVIDIRNEAAVTYHNNTSFYFHFTSSSSLIFIRLVPLEGLVNRLLENAKITYLSKIHISYLLLLLVTNRDWNITYVLIEVIDDTELQNTIARLKAW